MNPKQIAKQMIAFNKTAFDNNFNAMNALHEQTEKLINKFWEKTPMFPEDGKKAVNDWINAYKKGRAEFKATADESYKKVTEYFAKAEKEEGTKAGKK